MLDTQRKVLKRNSNREGEIQIEIRASHRPAEGRMACQVNPPTDRCKDTHCVSVGWTMRPAAFLLSVCLVSQSQADIPLSPMVTLRDGVKMPIVSFGSGGDCGPDSFGK